MQAPAPQIPLRCHPNSLTLVPIILISTLDLDTADNYEYTMSTCRYFNSPRGCQHNPCRFIHDSPPQADDCAFSNQGVFSLARSTAPRSQPTFPLGICWFYCKFGYCKHADQCKYRHVEPGSSLPNGHLRPASPFFGDSAMASPAEETAMPAVVALRRLTTYCDPHFLFTKPIQMVPFVKLLIAAEPAKGNWVSILLGPLTLRLTFVMPIG
jgi:hypothetical protein